MKVTYTQSDAEITLLNLLRQNENERMRNGEFSQNYEQVDIEMDTPVQEFGVPIQYKIALIKMLRTAFADEALLKSAADYASNQPFKPGVGLAQAKIWIEQYWKW